MAEQLKITLSPGVDYDGMVEHGKISPNQSFMISIIPPFCCSVIMLFHLEGLPVLSYHRETKIGITYTQLLQEENIFPMMPRSG